MRRTLGSVSRMVLLAATMSAAGGISEQCKIHEDDTTIVCQCVGNEEFFLPEGYNYENVTSLRVAACSFANLHFSSLTEANGIADVIVQNISERLIFEPFLTSNSMKRLKLSKIGRIPLITRDTFISLKNIESFWIEDTRIHHFQERFADIAVTNWTMINVTIERVDELNLLGKGGMLRIKDSEFHNVTGSLNFACFSGVEILRSRFQLQKPGRLSVEGDLVLIEDCIFSNASANIVAANGIRINATCADGKSSMRLSSNRIESVNNRLPTEIVYTRNERESKRFFSRRNNTVCIAGNCKCPKSGGDVGGRATVQLLLLLPTILLRFSVFS